MKKVAAVPKKITGALKAKKTKPVTLEGVAASVDRLDGKTNRLEKAVDTLGSRTNRLEKAVGALDARTTRVEKAVDRLSGKVDKLEITLERTFEKLSNKIESSIENLAIATQRGFADMEKRMDRVEDRLDGMVTKKEFNAYAENDGRTTILILSEIESIKHRMELADEDRRKKDLALQAHDARITQLEAVV